MKNHTRTSSGLTFNPLKPQENTYTIEDIAVGLSNTCRFGGQREPFFSVAEHCIEIYHHPDFDNDLDLQLGALLHDAEEAYFLDYPSPWKHLLQLGGISVGLLGERHRKEIYKQLKVQYPSEEQWALIKKIESENLNAERECSVGLSPSEAKRRYLEEYEYLKKKLTPVFTISPNSTNQESTSKYYGPRPD